MLQLSNMEHSDHRCHQINMWSWFNPYQVNNVTYNTQLYKNNIKQIQFYQNNYFKKATISPQNFFKDILKLWIQTLHRLLLYLIKR